MLVGEKIRKVKSLIIKKIVKNNQGMRNDCGVMAANDVIKKSFQKLSWKAFVQSLYALKIIFSEADTVKGVHLMIHKNMVREPIWKMMNEKAAEP